MLTEGSPKAKSDQSLCSADEPCCVAVSALPDALVGQQPEIAPTRTGEGQPDANRSVLALIVNHERAAVGQSRERRGLAHNAG